MLFRPARHAIERVRYEPKRRLLTVATRAQLTPSMLRFTFTSPDLADFRSRAPDDHVKLFLPDPHGPGEVMRDYTPRAFDEARKILTLDFALHDAGPATAWALAAQPGDRLAIGGPRGSLVVADDFDAYLLVGDETALPAIGRRLEFFSRANVPITTLVVVDGPEHVQTFDTKADWTPIWVFRRGAHADDATLLRRALAAWATPQGDAYVWIAAEAGVARRLRDYMLEDRGHPKAWLKASGYWVRGHAGAHEKLET